METFDNINGHATVIGPTLKHLFLWFTPYMYGVHNEFVGKGLITSYCRVSQEVIRPYDIHIQVVPSCAEFFRVVPHFVPSCAEVSMVVPNGAEFFRAVPSCAEFFIVVPNFVPSCAEFF